MNRRVARVPVRLEILTELLQGNLQPATSTAPADLKVIGAMIENPAWLTLVVESDSLAEVAEGDLIPLLTIVMSREGK